MISESKTLFVLILVLPIVLLKPSLIAPFTPPNNVMVSSFTSDLTLVEKVVSPQTIPLGQILLRKRYLTSEELSEALALQSSYRVLLGEILIRSGYINPKQLETALQEQKWRVRGFWLIN